MKKKIAKLWVKALRSGDYKQGIRRLRTKDNKFCCLGVLCNLHAQLHPQIAASEKNKLRYLGEEGRLPMEVLLWADMHSGDGTLKSSVFREDSLIELNDVWRYDFDQIAAHIKKNWQYL